MQCPEISGDLLLTLWQGTLLHEALLIIDPLKVLKVSCLARHGTPASKPWLQGIIPGIIETLVMSAKPLQKFLNPGPGRPCHTVVELKTR